MFLVQSNEMVNGIVLIAYTVKIGKMKETWNKYEEIIKIGNK